MKFLKLLWKPLITTLFLSTILAISIQADNIVFLPIIVKPAPPPLYEPKKGVSLAYSNCEDVDTLNAGWYINQSHVPPSNCPANDRRFIPRLYDGNTATDPEKLSIAINNAKASGWLTGFVEPNLPTGGNTTPYQGAVAWRAIEQAALPEGIKLLSPAPSQHEPGYFDPLGYTWLWKMVEIYKILYGEKPHFDAIAWNYYDSTPQAFQNFFNARHQEAIEQGYENTPFWVMEYAGKCWDSNKFPTGNDEIMTQVTPMFKDSSWITRYAWFANRITGTEPWGQNHQSCSLIDPNNGTLTKLGSLYAQY